MKIIVSACLLGENCKYNGGNNKNEHLMELLKDKEVIPVCPEMLGGLPAPREPVELVDNIPKTRDGRDVSQEFRIGIQRGMELCKEQDISCAILQSRSPTCGKGRIYNGSFSGTLTAGNGMFTRELMKQGIAVFDVEEYINR